MKTLLTLLILLISGCTSVTFDRKYEQTDANLKPERLKISYCSLGGKEYQGLDCNAPGGWNIKVNKSKQQEIKVETLMAEIAEMIAGMKK